MTNKEAAESVKSKVGRSSYARFVEMLLNENPERAAKFLCTMGIFKEEIAQAVQYEEEVYLSDFKN